LLEFQSGIYKKFPLLFPKPVEDVKDEFDKDEPEEEDDDEKPAKKTPRELFAEKWFFYPILRELAGGGNDAWMKIDEVVKMPLMDCLIELSYRRELADIENYERMKQDENSIF
jgi:hypothetical protein